MADAKRGINQILLFRKLGDTESAKKLLFQTEHNIDRSIDGADSTATKDGPISSPGTPAEEISFSSIAAYNDEVYDFLLDAWRKRDTLEIWVVDKGADPVIDESTQVTSYPGTYYRGKINDFNETAAAEDLIELDGNIVVDGIPQSGMATLTEAQAEVVQYAFTDTNETPADIQ